MRDEVAVAGAAARAAGAVVLNYYGGDYAVRDKGAIDTPAGLVDNPVTSADLEADALLREMLLAPYPDYGWLSEETADSPERLERSTIWIVDPIDGTKEFLEQIPEFVVSIALVEEGVPVVAAMYNPALDDLYIANRDGGCFLNGKRVFCTAADLLAEAALIVSRSETRRTSGSSSRGATTSSTTATWRASPTAARPSASTSTGTRASTTTTGSPTTTSARDRRRGGRAQRRSRSGTAAPR